MNTDEQAFRAQLERDGFEISEIVREANLENEDHSHDFTARALVIAGEVSVVTAAGTTTCRSGDTFSLDAGIVHHERYGPDGARFVLGRKQLVSP